MLFGEMDEEVELVRGDEKGILCVVRQPSVERMFEEEGGERGV